MYVYDVDCAKNILSQTSVCAYGYVDSRNRFRKATLYQK